MRFVNNQVERLYPTACMLGEGPLWVPEQNSIYWVDIKEYRLHRYNLDTNTHKSWNCDEQITSLAKADDGGFVGTFRHGASLFSLREDSNEIDIQKIVRPTEETRNNRFNDAKIDPMGRLWAGSMDDFEERGSGNLYRFDADLRPTVVDRNYVITNGPAFSNDGKTLYHTDTLERKIYRFDLASDGSLSNKRLFLKIPEFLGYPDGMTIDQDDCLWVCFFSGWGINRYTGEGKYVGRVELPVANITSCTFGGEDMSELYITTARKGLTAAEIRTQPYAGSLFRYQTETKGQLAPVFRSGAKIHTENDDENLQFSGSKRSDFLLNADRPAANIQLS